MQEKKSGLYSASPRAVANSFSCPASVLVGKNSKLIEGRFAEVISNSFDCFRRKVEKRAALFHRLGWVGGNGLRRFATLRRSVAVAVRLERPFDFDADVFGLLRCQLGDHAAEAADHLGGHFLVELLW